MTGPSHAHKESLGCSIFDMLCEFEVAVVVAMALRGNPTVTRQGLHTQKAGLPKAIMPCSSVSCSDESYLTKEKRVCRIWGPKLNLHILMPWTCTNVNKLRTRRFKCMTAWAVVLAKGTLQQRSSKSLKFALNAKRLSSECCSSFNGLINQRVTVENNPLVHGTLTCILANL